MGQLGCRKPRQNHNKEMGSSRGACVLGWGFEHMIL